MKNVLKVISLMMLCGALFVGCGSSNNGSGSACSINGGTNNGTMVNGNCSLSNGVSGQCTNPQAPYYIASVPDPQLGGQAIPACCSSPSIVQGEICYPANNGVGGYGGYGGAQSCPRGVNPYTGQCY